MPLLLLFFGKVGEEVPFFSFSFFSIEKLVGVKPHYIDYNNILKGSNDADSNNVQL